MRIFPFRLTVVTIVLYLLPSAQAGTFKNPSLISTSYDPKSVVSADFNGDEKLDIVYLDGTTSRTLHTLLGNGDGTFSHAQDMLLPEGIGGYSSAAINVADVTGDGVLDLVIGGGGTSTAQVGVLRGKGDGTFQAAIVSTFVANTSGNFPALVGRIGLEDINGDGAVDMAVADPMNSVIWVALGDRSGHFTFLTLLPAGYASTVYFSDLNGDGNPDLVTLDTLGALALVRMGKGDGTFQNPVQYSMDASTQAMFLADIDLDGHPDLVAQTYPYQITVLKGNSDGTFASSVVVATVPSDALLSGAGDFNGDGIADLIFLNAAGVGILLGKGNLSFGTMTSTLAAASNSFMLGQGDFNQDGHRDIALGVESGILILNGRGDGKFVSADIYDVGHMAGTAAVADFNGDSIPDIAVTMPADFPRILLGNGLGTFTLAKDQNTTYGSQAPGISMAQADFNGDGKKDLVVIEVSSQSPYGGPVVLFGNGDGTFAAPLSPPNGSTLVGDANGDGRNDMVSVAGPSIVVSLGQASKTFTDVDTALRNPTFSGVMGIADFNRDGKPDLLVYAYTAIEVWLGNGNGSFTYSNRIDFNGYVQMQNVAIADLDGDGNNDFLLSPAATLTDSPSPLMILYGRGDGSFEAPQELPVPRLYTQVVIADVNRDNKPDLVLTDGHEISVMTSVGTRTFSSEDHYVAGQSISQLNVIDVNRDGFPDIVTTAGGSIVSVLLNQPSGQQSEGAPTSAIFNITPEPANYGQPIQLTFTVSSTSATGPIPTGSVTFNVDGTFISTSSLSGGRSTYTLLSTLPTGQHTFIATYDGDSTYRAQSFAALHEVLPPVYATSTTLTATPSTILASQTIRLTARVTSTPAVPAGIVVFTDNNATLGSEVVNSGGVAVFDTAMLAAGIHHLTATYTGFQNHFGLQEIYSPSTSALLSVTVQSNGTSTAISASISTVVSGSVLTLNASVSSSAGVPFGSVAFYDSGTFLGASSLLADGTTTFNTASLTVGTHTLNAVFNANGTFASSASSTVTVSVTPADSILHATSVILSVSTDPQTSRTISTAKVRSLSDIPGGSVTFMDSGAILGKASTDEGGTATLVLPALSSGTHNLSASFQSSMPFAASVSPDYEEKWPASGPGFFLGLGANELVLDGQASIDVPIVITSISGFQQQVQLSCSDGLPDGYTCSFAPGTINGEGSSILTIRRALTSRTQASSLGIECALLGGLFLIGTVFVSRRPSCRYLALAVIVGCVSWLGACGASSRDSREIRVLSIRASSGFGVTAIIHSAQLELKVRGPN
jgi:hypothetical protein